MQAGPSRTIVTDSESILPSFLTTLRSSSPISIPPQTLLGAITHYLSTLDDPLLSEFVTTVITSPSLWNSADISHVDIQNALRLSVPAKIAIIENATKEIYFAESRRRRRARRWLNSLIEAVISLDHSTVRLKVLISVLEGLDDAPTVEWGSERMTLEEEVVLAFAEWTELENTEGMDLLCTAIPQIDVARLRALNMIDLAPKIRYALIDLVNPTSSQKPQDIAPILSRALARSYEVLNSGGPTSQHHAWETMRTFCTSMREVGEKLEGGFSDQRGSNSGDTDSWERHKTAFFAFLLPASTILDITLQDAGSYPSIIRNVDIPRSAEMAIQLLLTLGTFAFLTDLSDGGFEHYHRILYGSLDIIAEQSGTPSAERLFRELSSGSSTSLSDARAAYILLLGEELVHHLGSRSIDILLPLAEKHAHRPAHRASFEAAHAFLLSLLRSASETLEMTTAQGDFFDALLPNYLHILTKQAKRGDITPDQLKDAFPLVVEAAARRSPLSIQICLDSLNTLLPSAETRMIRIAVAPHIPAERLRGYLDELAGVIMTTPKDSEERLDLARRAFEMVIKDLGDDVKESGVEWWMKWRNEFEGTNRHGQGFIRSRL
ncbi:hypothetical protein CI109_104612 [Kwoniella shandongensis]|uniref:Uncharacterized protein n=1 Tax=Kwoniella shandongensis TaxID=1734106 RepID=A0A5M6BV99_9TREE|nr:uncharacterized protein CI109_004778 [Kwoniella shandongensis]KAA5526778.1 hypothetical protein CI109_004778 [Kwoniella shandongensis]